MRKIKKLKVNSLKFKRHSILHDHPDVITMILSVIRNIVKNILLRRKSSLEMRRKVGCSYMLGKLQEYGQEHEKNMN